MKHLTLLVPDGPNNLSSVVGVYKLFSRANACFAGSGRTPVFSVQLAGLSDTVGYYDDLFYVKPHVHVSAVERTDLVIIPSLNHRYEDALKENEPLVGWIRRQYEQGAEIASICTGAFLLAETGLLNGKSCSTHWAAAEAFRTRFPEVRLQPDRLITDEKGLYTNGGAYSFLNLMLYLIEKYYDRETAIFCAKVFQIDIDRESQSAFMLFSGQKQHADEMVRKAQTYVEEHLHEKLSVEGLSEMFAVGRRNFDRRFFRATGNSPIEYLQRVRVEAAKKAFENSRKTVHEVMYDVGYSDTKAFRDVFRRVTGLSPLAYRERYNKN